MPSYLQVLQGETLATAVTEHILEKTAVLYTEAEVLLSQEVRGVGPALLRAMLGNIAYGCTEPNEIGQRVGRPETSMSGALRLLVDYGLLTRSVPFTVANPERTRSTHYYLADNYLAFWFRFVQPNRSLLEQGAAAAVWRTRIEPNFSTFMGLRFEDACRQFIRLQPHRWTHQSAIWAFGGVGN